MLVFIIILEVWIVKLIQFSFQLSVLLSLTLNWILDVIEILLNLSLLRCVWHFILKAFLRIVLKWEALELLMLILLLWKLFDLLYFRSKSVESWRGILIVFNLDILLFWNQMWVGLFIFDRFWLLNNILSLVIYLLIVIQVILSHILQLIF